MIVSHVSNDQNVNSCVTVGFFFILFYFVLMAMLLKDGHMSFLSKMLGLQFRGQYLSSGHLAYL